MKNIVTFLTCCILFTGFSINAQSQAKNNGVPLIKTFSPDEYKGHRQVWSCVQDSKGLMYFGTENGVIEYDGNNWRLVNTPENMRIRSLCRDSSGVIYVDLKNADRTKYDSREFH